MKQEPIIVGQAHVPWAPAAQANKDRPALPSGWVLPGGARTQNREEAWAAAAAINDLFVKLATK